jgi:hypothetical protein
MMNDDARLPRNRWPGVVFRGTKLLRPPCFRVAATLDGLPIAQRHFFILRQCLALRPQHHR